MKPVHQITKVFLFGLSLMLLLLAACNKDDTSIIDPPYALDLPEGFPTPYIPSDNLLTQKKVALGKKLFFDPILSKDSTISCSSCHRVGLAFSDDKAFSKGVDDSIGFRNAMPLVNVAYNASFFWDGGVPSLELQAIAPITAEFEMHENLEVVIEKISRNESYQKLFFEVFGTQPELSLLLKSIASFERTLISGNSAYDRETNQGLQTLSSSQVRGRDLFFSDNLKCSTCHSGFNFTNNKFENNGIYDIYTDLGRRRVTVRYQDDGKFKVPTLRNVELTSPYMHDGSMATLEQVVEHYNSGGKSHFNKSSLIKPLYLTAQDKTDLVNFLKSLTDYSFINNPKFIP